MTYEQLLKDPFLDLPIRQSNGQHFDRFFKVLMKDFQDKINSLEPEILYIPGVSSDISFIKNSQDIMVSGLLRVIKHYYNGSPYKAYQQLDRTLRNDIKDFYGIIKQTNYSQNENFYRIRLKKENFPLDGKDLFHIPFELRGKVSTQRYSIPGFPSLYLGRTLYVCWEEMSRPPINEFQVIRLKNTQPIKFLDLTPPNLNGDLRTLEVYRYLMTWPLIAACSIKVKDYSDTFKPEYIVPQLLLQWVRENDEIDGIRYKSTHIDSRYYRTAGEFYNLVLPVKENKSSGHCEKLKSMFEMTDTVSWQLYQFALGGATFVHNIDEMVNTNQKLPMLELIKGKEYPYSYSVLGQLEMYLDEMKTKKIQ